jgi:hypothetical protein
MTAVIRSLDISFDLERHCILCGKDDVCHTLAKTSVEIHQVRLITTLPDKFHSVRTPLHYFEPRIRHVPPLHLASSPTANPHSTR